MTASERPAEGQAQVAAKQALTCADVVWRSETDGPLDFNRLRDLQEKYVAAALQAAEAERDHQGKCAVELFDEVTRLRARLRAVEGAWGPLVKALRYTTMDDLRWLRDNAPTDERVLAFNAMATALTPGAGEEGKG